MKTHLLTIVVTLWLLEDTAAVKKWTSVKIRHNLFNISHNVEAFIDMPKSTEGERLKDFQIVQEEDSCYPLDLYCLRDDSSLCLYYDKNGTIAGIQISYREEDVRDVDPHDYSFSKPNFIKTNYFNIPAYSFRVYFTNPKELTEEGRNDTSEVAEGLWAELDGELVRFDTRCQPNSPVLGDFDMQGCYPKLGQIYARKFNEKTRCQDAFLVYLLFEGGSLIGFGHGIPGKARPGPCYDVYDHPPASELNTLIPNPPPCLFNYVRYGFTVVNVYFINDPWSIRCPKCYCPS